VNDWASAFLRKVPLAFVRIGTTNATSAGAAAVRPGPGSSVNAAADPLRPFRGGEGEGRHRDRPLPEVFCAGVGSWSRGGRRGAAPAVGGSVETQMGRGLRDGGWGGAGRCGGARAGQVGEDGLDGEGVLHGGEAAQPVTVVTPRLIDEGRVGIEPGAARGRPLLSLAVLVRRHYLRSGLKPVRSSSEKNCGCSHAAK
jgi:hypothetical protein